ncbi:MAG: pyruvate kinase [Nitrososphaerota archaeon]|nr:pyruvate kinase [Nitrososphaerota archaeon]MDG6941839.1 pyruvate kinase [Nitrososphaerota archaeon]MDG6946988.1 pyruvate kinase [Nitrososphaerota archaeon]MDG6950600.1 pyruvate kinase [Nitrososphaerota archaeon]
MRKTKIVVTIGPASSVPETVRKLVGLVDVFRINFSHGDKESHLNEIRTIRAEARRYGKTVAILQDLPGPKIRVGKMANGSAELAQGSAVVLDASDAEGDSHRIPVNYPPLLGSLEKGDTLHLADGVIRLRVDAASHSSVACTVLAGGVLSSGKGVNAPGVKLEIAYPTKTDQTHLQFGVRQKVDFVAASFVRSASDLRSIRRLLPQDGPMLIAKIEKMEAVKAFDSILAESDGIMVARGDLGIEVPIETVPEIQKRIITKCNDAAKPVIVATQMLVSMVSSPVPSRAEVTDVSTAILEGTDAVMLSDETTVGKYPVEAVKMLDRIARTTERSPHTYEVPPLSPTTHETGPAIARAACRLADYVGAKAIVAPTQTGSTARRVSMNRPSQPIVAICSSAQVARWLSLYRGVVSIVTRQAKTVDWLFGRADAAAEELGLARKGDLIVVISGTPGVKGTTNHIKVSVVGRKD